MKFILNVTSGIFHPITHSYHVHNKLVHRININSIWPTNGVECVPTKCSGKWSMLSFGWKVIKNIWCGIDAMVLYKQKKPIKWKCERTRTKRHCHPSFMKKCWQAEYKLVWLYWLRYCICTVDAHMRNFYSQLLLQNSVQMFMSDVIFHVYLCGVSNNSPHNWCIIVLYDVIFTSDKSHTFTKGKIEHTDAFWFSRCFTMW